MNYSSEKETHLLKKKQMKIKEAEQKSRKNQIILKKNSIQNTKSEMMF